MITTYQSTTYPKTIFNHDIIRFLNDKGSLGVRQILKPTPSRRPIMKIPMRRKRSKCRAQPNRWIAPAALDLGWYRTTGGTLWVRERSYQYKSSNAKMRKLCWSDFYYAILYCPPLSELLYERRCLQTESMYWRVAPVPWRGVPWRASFQQSSFACSTVVGRDQPTFIFNMLRWWHYIS